MDQSYPKKVRLRRRREIDQVLQTGRRATGTLLRILVCPNGRTYPRFAPLVPRRIGRAVRRNRWKRLLRESFRKNRSALEPWDIVAIPLCPPDALRQPDVEAEFLGLVARLTRPVP